MRSHEPPADHATPSETSARWRIAVSGLGRAGVGYAMAIAGHPGCELAGLIDSRGDRRAFMKGAGFKAPLESSLGALVAKSAPHAIVLCGSGSSRAADVTAAIAAGISVLADGRLADRTAEADALEGEIARARALVTCGSAVLLHPLFRRAGTWLADGALGPLVRVQTSAYVSRVFSAASRPTDRDVLDPMADDALMLLDRFVGPATAGAVRAQALYGTGPDELHAELFLAHGATGSLDLSWCVPGYPRPAIVVEAEGSRGRLLASDDAIELSLTEPFGQLGVGEHRVVDEGGPPRAPFEAGEPSAVLARFVDALNGDAAAMAELDPQRALRVTRLREAIRAATPLVAARATP